MHDSLLGLKTLKKRIDENLSNFKSIYGCYVNAGQIISKFDISILDLTLEEKEMYAKLFKKSLSGKPYKNLTPLELGDTENQKSLYSLSKSLLKEDELISAFFDNIIDNLETDKNYCILLVSDVIENEEESYPYILCAISPIKDTKAELRYNSKEFRSNSTGNILTNPFLGFVYPAFVEDAADIYSSVYFYSKELHEELIEGIFACEIPQTAEEQKDAFQDLLAESLEDDYTLKTTAQLQEKLIEFSEDNDMVFSNDIKEALSETVPEEKLDTIENNLGNAFECFAENLIEKKFTIKTTDSVITTEAPSNIKIEEINGRKYILIPASGVTVNGKEVKF